MVQLRPRPSSNDLSTASTSPHRSLKRKASAANLNEQYYAPEPLLLSEEVITLLVGEHKKTFLVHKNVLIKTSLRFQAALSGPWIESLSGVIELPDEDPAMMTQYVTFLYRGTIHLRKPAGYNEFNNAVTEAVKLHALAGRLMDDVYETHVINSIIHYLDPTRHKVGYLPSAECINEAYEQPETSKLRGLLVDQWTQFAEAKTMQQLTWGCLNQDFLVDVLCSMAGKRPTPKDKSPVTMDNACRYHSHASNEKCLV